MAEHVGSRVRSPRRGAAMRLLLSSLGWVWRFRFLAVAVIAIATVSTSYAVSSITNLGKPVDIQSTASYFPLSGFHRVRATPRTQGKPELLMIGVLGDLGPDAYERWPVVKALDQFGSLSKVRQLPESCWPSRGPTGRIIVCSDPTFDLSRSRYRSTYLTFVSRDIARVSRGRFRIGQRLTRSERLLFIRYAALPGHTRLPGAVRFATLPLITVGGYIQTTSQILNSGDFGQQFPVPSPTTSRSADRYVLFSFATIHNALVRGKDPTGSRVVEDVNAEANIITALICHADGKRPGSVCNRPAIKAILKHVK